MCISQVFATVIKYLSGQFYQVLSSGGTVSNNVAQVLMRRAMASHCWSACASLALRPPCVSSATRIESHVLQPKKPNLISSP